MKTQKSIVLCVLTFFLIVGLGQDVFSEKNVYDKKVVEKLKFTPEERKKIEEIKLETEKESIKIGAEIRVKMLELRHLLESPDTNEKEVDRLIEEIGALKTKAMKSRVHSLLEIKKILGVERSEELKRIIEEGIKDAPPFAEKRPLRDKFKRDKIKRQLP